MSDKKPAKTGAQRAKEYRERHLEKAKERQRDWYERNKVKIQEEKARVKRLQEFFGGFTEKELEKAREVVLEQRKRE